MGLGMRRSVSPQRRRADSSAVVGLERTRHAPMKTWEKTKTARRDCAIVARRMQRCARERKWQDEIRVFDSFSCLGAPRAAANQRRFFCRQNKHLKADAMNCGRERHACRGSSCAVIVAPRCTCLLMIARITKFGIVQVFSV